MKIGIDTFCSDSGKSGLGTYIYYLTQSLPKDAGAEYLLFGQPEDRYTYSGDIPFAEARCGESSRAQKFWHNFSSKGFYKRHGIQAVLYPAAAKMLPGKFSVPGVAVLHDPLSVTLFKSRLFQKSLLKSFGLLQKIIVPTNFLKNDLLGLGIDGNKICVVRHGIDHSRFFPLPLSDSDYVEVKPFAIKRPYIIYASRISGPGKKHVELISAFDIFKKKTGLPHRLVLAGVQDAWAEQVNKAALSSPFASDIILTGFFPHESLPALYAAAAACVFPSVQEGVGLPVIEAMATGIPVACSSAGALAETSGGAAVLFDSDNIQEMALAIERVVTDEDARQRLISAGTEWSKKFNWDETARKTVEVFQTIGL